MALAGEPAGAARACGWPGAPRAGRRDAVRVRLRAGGRGVAHVFAVDARGTRAGRRGGRAVRRAGTVRVAVRVPRAGAVRRVVVAFEAAGGGTDSAAAVVRAG